VVKSAAQQALPIIVVQNVPTINLKNQRRPKDL